MAGRDSIPIDEQLAIIRAEIAGMDRVYARLALERINHLANDALHMLPAEYHGPFLAIMRTAQSG